MNAPWKPALRGIALAAALLLSGPLPPASAAPDGPHVEIHTLQPAPARGVLRALTATDATLLPAGGTEPRSHPLAGIREIRFVDAKPRKPSGARFRAHLTGGDKLVGALRGPSETGVVLTIPGLGDLDLPFDVLLTLEWMPADAGPCHDLADKHPRAPSGDVVYDAGNDEYRGTVLEATAKEVVVESRRGRKRTIPWTGLRVIHLENDLLPPVDGLTGEIELTNGTRIALAKPPTLTARGLTVTSRSMPDAERSIAMECVQSMRWWGGQFVYASTLPFKSERRPYYADPEGLMDPAYLERWFGTRVDRRASGCPLRIGGQRYRRGFGVNSHSIIEIPLDGAYKSFVTGFGIDDEVLLQASASGGRGNVDARVLADGKVIWEKKGVEGGTKALRVGPLDVSDAKTLVLEVGFGKNFMTLDRADWVDPILVRK